MSRFGKIGTAVLLCLIVAPAARANNLTQTVRLAHHAGAPHQPEHLAESHHNAVVLATKVLRRLANQPDYHFLNDPQCSLLLSRATDALAALPVAKLIELLGFYDNYGKRWSDPQQISLAFIETMAGGFPTHRQRLLEDHNIPQEMQLWSMARAHSKFMESIGRKYTNTAVIRHILGMQNELHQILQSVSRGLEDLGDPAVLIKIVKGLGEGRLSDGSDLDILVRPEIEMAELADGSDRWTTDMLREKFFRTLEERGVPFEHQLLGGRRMADEGRQVHVFGGSLSRIWPEFYEIGIHVDDPSIRLELEPVVISIVEESAAGNDDPRAAIPFS